MIEECEKRKKQQTDQLSAEQRGLVELRKEMDMEALEARKRREKQLLEAVRLKQENEKYKEIVDKRRMDEREEEKKLMEIVNAAQREQERKQLEEIKAKEARIQALAKYAEEHVTKNETAKRRLEEQRFLKSVLDKEKRDELDEIRRKKEHREREINARRYLDDQMKEKEEKTKEEEKQSRALAESWRKDEVAYRREVKEKTSANKKRNALWYGEIVKQMNETQALRKRGSLMDDREYRLNKKLLEETAAIANPLQFSPPSAS